MAADRLDAALSTRPLKDLAASINVYLKRFEADPIINAASATYGTRPYYHASATYYRGAKLSVTYVSYQGSSKLSKAEAAQYLAWLDDGNVGRHWEAQRDV